MKSVRPSSKYLGQQETSTSTHELRLKVIAQLVLKSGAKNVADLGCGSGELLALLAAEKQFTRLVGLDPSLSALQIARQRLATKMGLDDERISLIHGSVLTGCKHFADFEVAIMVETIEHINPTHLSKVEQNVFRLWHPAVAIITTPNQEWNKLLGLNDSTLRHDDHRFEWTRAKFRAWSAGIAQRNSYDVSFEDLGPSDLFCGSPTQMAVFRSLKIIAARKPPNDFT